MLYGAFWTSVLPLTESYLLKRDKAALQNYGRADDRPVGDFQQSREAFERDLIGRALAQSAGNVVEAAKRLGLGRSTLYKKIVALGMRLDSGTRLEIETN